MLLHATTMVQNTHHQDNYSDLLTNSFLPPLPSYSTFYKAYMCVCVCVWIDITPLLKSFKSYPVYSVLNPTPLPNSSELYVFFTPTTSLTSCKTTPFLTHFSPTATLAFLFVLKNLQKLLSKGIPIWDLLYIVCSPQQSTESNIPHPFRIWFKHHIVLWSSLITLYKIVTHVIHPAPWSSRFSNGPHYAE